MATLQFDDCSTKSVLGHRPGPLVPAIWSWRQMMEVAGSLSLFAGSMAAPYRWCCTASIQTLVRQP